MATMVSTYYYTENTVYAMRQIDRASVITMTLNTTDIAIGAPNAEIVQMFRSYPVVKVIASIATDRRELPQTDYQVRATICVHLQPNVGNSNLAVALRLKLRLDPQFGRALFYNDKTNEKIWEVQATEQKHCEEFDLVTRYKDEHLFVPVELELIYENLNAPSNDSAGESPEFR